MDTFSLKQLRELNQELDIFTCINPEPALIKQGLHPPLPVAGKTLIWGFSLLQAAEKLHLPGLICRLLPEMDKPAMLKLALQLENRPGKYDWQEKAQILQYLGQDNTITPQLAGLLEGRQETGLQERYRQYLSLHPALQQLIRENALSLKTAVQIRELPEKIFIHMQEQRQQLHLTCSETRILLTLFFEVFMRDKLSAETACRQFAALLAGPIPLTAIRVMRYPRLTALESQFTAFKNHYLKGSGINLKIPENFEGAEFALSFAFTPANLQKKMVFLKQIQEHLDELESLL